MKLETDILNVLKEVGDQPVTASYITSQVKATYGEVMFALRRQLGLKGQIYRRRAYLPNKRGFEQLQWGYQIENPEMTRRECQLPAKKKKAKQLWYLRRVHLTHGGAHVKFETERWYHPGLERYMLRRVAVRLLKTEGVLLVEVHKHRPKLKAKSFD